MLYRCLTEAPSKIFPVGQFPFDLLQLEAEMKVGDTPYHFAEPSSDHYPAKHFPLPTPRGALAVPGWVLQGLTQMQQKTCQAWAPDASSCLTLPTSRLVGVSTRPSPYQK